MGVDVQASCCSVAHQVDRSTFVGKRVIPLANKEVAEGRIVFDV